MPALDKYVPSSPFDLADDSTRGGRSGNPFDFLAFLDTPAGQRFLTGFQRVNLARGALIAAPGERDNRVFIVRSGRVRVYLADEHRELTLAFLEPGDAFSTHTPTYVAVVAPTVLEAIDTHRFAAKLAAQAEAVPSIMRVLGKLLNGSIELIESLVFRDAASRLAHFLARTVRHQGRHEGTHWSVPFPWTLADLALLLGTTRQTVSEVVNQLERAGVLERRGRRVLVVHDLDALERHGRAPAAASAGRRTRAPRRV